MPLTILGLSGALGHDASAALLLDGEIVAAVEEERLLRDKHARGQMPLESARWCLEQAGLSPGDVDIVSIPMAPVSLMSPARWHYAGRYWYAPDRALDALFNGNRRYRRYLGQVRQMLQQLGFRPAQVQVDSIEHHLAHAASCYAFSGFDDKTAIMGIDGKGEYATTFFGYGEQGQIHRIAECYDPDSLGGLYGALTQYLGFDMLDGEYKVMGMAPYGDPERIDLSRLVQFKGGRLRVNTRYANVVGLRRYKEASKGYYFSPRLVDWLGPRRTDDAADEPYIHYAAAVQDVFERISLAMMDYYLGDILRDTGKLAFAGGGALNVKLNQKIIARPEVRELFVQPAAGDAGTALGAAAVSSQQRGVPVAPMRHAYHGPGYTTDQVLAACRADPRQPQLRQMADVPGEVAALLAAGHPVAWFQGRMEFGPRALGARSILGCPSIPGMADRINAQIKYRERWRPFCPSMTEEAGAQMFATAHPAPFMTFTFEVSPGWRERVPEVVHADGTARPQFVGPQDHPRYFALLQAMEKLTGNAVLLNTSLNRRGEAMVCSPEDALEMFFGSDLQYLVMEDVLCTKPG